jgi:pyrimidine operon attenuation protein/uracil phosphoribosyltransferase
LATQILNSRQIEQRINRIAYQIYEDNFNEQELLIAGIARSGFVFAQRLQQALNNICPLKTRLIEVKLDKENPVENTRCVEFRKNLNLQYPPFFGCRYKKNQDSFIGQPRS